MILGTLKLDSEDRYVYVDRTLPTGPSWDKELLKAFISCNVISEEGKEILPPSLQKIAYSDKLGFHETTLAIKISEIAAFADILIVTRVSSKPLQGDKFRFDNFEMIVATGQLEIWKHKGN